MYEQKQINSNKESQKEGDSQYKVVGEYYIVNLNKVLGKGSYGLVYQAIDQRNIEKQVAVKQIKRQIVGKNQDKLLMLLKNEISNMKLIQDKNVVQLLDVMHSPNNIYLIVEYCNGGSLDQYLKKNDGWLSETDTLRIIKQIISGFKCLYEQKIVHRDLKPANILIHDGILKIADFGFSKVVEHDMEQAAINSFVGSPMYMCPQLLNQQQYSSKVDIWSLGVIFYEMLYASTPWQGKSFQELKQNINTGKLVFPDTPIVSEKTKKFIASMLEKEEDKRIKWEDLFAFSSSNEWFNRSKLMISKFQMKEEMTQEEEDEDDDDNADEFAIEEEINPSQIVNKNKSQLEKNNSFISEEEELKQKKDLEELRKTQKLNAHHFKKKRAIFSTFEVDQHNQQNQIANDSKKEQKIRNLESLNIVAHSLTKPGEPPISKEMSQQQQYSTLFTQYSQADEEKQVIQEVSQWVLHRRNKAVFLNTITLKFYDLVNSKMLEIPLQLFYSVMFVLSKYQMMIIYKIFKRLENGQLEAGKVTKFTQAKWQLFVKSEERTQLLNFIQKDYNVIRQFFEELMKKAQIYFENLIKQNTVSPADQESIRIIQSICNKMLIDRTKFQAIYDSYLVQFRTALMQYILDRNIQENKDFMSFLMHIHNATNIRSIFKYKREPRFDFMKYYEQVSHSSAADLAKYLFPKN